MGKSHTSLVVGVFAFFNFYSHLFTNHLLSAFEDAKAMAKLSKDNVADVLESSSEQFRTARLGDFNSAVTARGKYFRYRLSNGSKSIP